jgi:glycosyltransferase involved in cell wall biosynthesis
MCGMDERSDIAACQGATGGDSGATAPPGPLLSVLIPTRNRAALLQQSLAALVESVVASGAEERVEIVCVDNFSGDDTPDVVQALATQHRFVRYEHHEALCPTAEVSMAAGVRFARGEHVWCFGDDDLPLPEAVPTLLRSLDATRSDFLLLNPLIEVADGETVEYFSAAEEVAGFASGRVFFRQFGLVSATTTLSCLCFRRTLFDADVALQCSDISPIYSHSVALLCMFHERPCAFLSTPVLVYRQNTVAEETERFSAWSATHELPMEWVFSTGLVGLLRFANGRTGIPLGELAYFEEVEVSKDSWTVQHSVLWAFIYRFALARIRALSGGDVGYGPEVDVELVQSVAAFLRETDVAECARAAEVLESAYARATELVRVRRTTQIELAAQRSWEVARSLENAQALCTRAEQAHFELRQQPAEPGVRTHEFLFGERSHPKTVLAE